MAEKNGFGEGQEAIIERIAWRVGDKIVERVVPLIEQRITTHSMECPTAKRVSKAFWIVLGVAAGIGLGGGFLVRSIVATLARGH
jgi:hypothetical protein